MTVQKKEHLERIDKFIDNYEGELTQKISGGLYEGDKLVARFKDNVSHFYIERV